MAPYLALFQQPWFCLRRHPRARRIRLRVERDGRVVLVAPPRAPVALLHRFVEEHRDWIEQQRERCRARAADSAIDGLLPTRLALRALGREIEVRYRQGTSRSSLRWTDEVLELGLPELGPAPVQAALVAALKQCARRELEPRLKAWARTHGLQVCHIGWRNQRSRWGSCSTRGSISLNVRLLFLPPQLADYVLVHELAHLDHPDHSPRFWSRVEAMLPGSQALRRELKSADRYLPGWI